MKWIVGLFVVVAVSGCFNDEAASSKNQGPERASGDAWAFILEGSMLVTSSGTLAETVDIGPLLILEETVAAYDGYTVLVREIVALGPTGGIATAGLELIGVRNEDLQEVPARIEGADYVIGSSSPDPYLKFPLTEGKTWTGNLGTAAGNLESTSTVGGADTHDVDGTTYPGIVVTTTAANADDTLALDVELLFGETVAHTLTQKIRSTGAGTSPDGNTATVTVNVMQRLVAVDRTPVAERTPQDTQRILDREVPIKDATGGRFIPTGLENAYLGPADLSLNGDDNTMVQFSLTNATSDAFASIGNATWVLEEQTRGIVASGFGTSFQHAFADVGQYRATLNVTDPDGAPALLSQAHVTVIHNATSTKSCGTATLPAGTAGCASLEVPLRSGYSILTASVTVGGTTGEATLQLLDAGGTVKASADVANNAASFTYEDTVDGEDWSLHLDLDLGAQATAQYSIFIDVPDRAWS